MPNRTLFLLNLIAQVAIIASFGGLLCLSFFGTYRNYGNQDASQCLLTITFGASYLLTWVIAIFWTLLTLIMAIGFSRNVDQSNKVFLLLFGDESAIVQEKMTACQELEASKELEEMI